MLAAIRSEPVDYVPMTVKFWGNPRHARATWRDEREERKFFAAHGWDDYISIWCGVQPDPVVRTEIFHEHDSEGPVLRQIWHTPTGTLTERLRVTDDWPEAQTATTAIGLLHDFRPPRYIEVPFKTMDDLATLPYLFPISAARQEAGLTAWHRQARQLADEFKIPLCVDSRPGLDWLLWLFPADEAVLRTVDSPDMIARLLAHIGAAYQTRMACLFSLGVDFLLRSGWYESADLWSPDYYRRFAVPGLEREFKAARAAGAAVVYLMDSGVIPLLPELKRLDFDCLAGVDPATAGGTDLAAVRRGLPGKSLWGGISGPLHFGRGTPAETEQAVERAFAACGKRGFILGPVVGFRHTWPWENLEGCDRAWRRLRA